MNAKRPHGQRYRPRAFYDRPHVREVYVEGETHTQTIEGFFGLFKTGVRGAHHSISHKWLQGYLNEWTWRYNRRGDDNRMFRDLIDTAAETTV